MTRRLPVALVFAGLALGFGHAVLTVEPPQRPTSVQCYEDGSCDDGSCEPSAPCDDSTDALTRP